MNTNIVHIEYEESIELLPEKAAYLPKHKALLIADVHLGKVNHFRKAGMAIPQATANKNLNLLKNLLEKYPSERVIFTGDLFHSELNMEWIHFKTLIENYSDRNFELIGGNHDVLHPRSYQNAGIIFHSNQLIIGNLRLLHEPPKKTIEGYYDLCGHIHPGYTLRGKGRQKITLPCFYFGTKTGVLPAFGHFTGLFPIEPEQNENIYLCVPNKIVEKISF